MLEAIDGWIWEPYEADWQRAMASLREYVRKTNSARVPGNYVDANGFRLGLWVENRRADETKGKLREDRRKQLESIKGWEWNSAGEARWREAYERLVGSESLPTGIPSNWVDEDGLRLGNWIVRSKNRLPERQAVSE